MTSAKSKLVNRDGDYYFCRLCDSWHRYRIDPSTPGHQHITSLDEGKTNSPSAKYYFCGICNKWHTSSKKDHVSYRLRVKRDPGLKPSRTNKTFRAPSKEKTHRPKNAIIGSFDGARGLWKSESELLDTIVSPNARHHCREILELVKALDKSLHIQCFTRRSGFSFIVKGLKIAEIKINSSGFTLTLIQNILNKGYTSVRQEKRDFIYNSTKAPVSKEELKKHFVTESRNLIHLRKNNIIGYREKWLHCLLIERMQSGNLKGLDLEFLYYEAPVGKVKRGKQFGREHVDILAKERGSKALVVVEVKKESLDLNSAISQGLSYIQWFENNREALKPRLAQLKWDVDMDRLKLILIAPGAHLNNAIIDKNDADRIKRLNCEVLVAHLNSNWGEDEDIRVNKISKI
jgi:hypothetical protein